MISEYNGLRTVRPFINSGIAYSGNQAMTLDADRYNAGGTADSLKATFNLAAHTGAPDDLRLDFVYKTIRRVPTMPTRSGSAAMIQGLDCRVMIFYANQPERGPTKIIQH